MTPTRDVLEGSLQEIAARADTIERTVPSIVGDYRRLGGILAGAGTIRAGIGPCSRPSPRQGILSTQELSIPYGVIWDVTIHRDVFDRLVGLATLTIKSVPRDQDDNIEAARPSLLLWPFMSRMGRVYAFVPQSRAPQLGFYGNTLRIAGLSVSDAETLKEMLLQKKTVSSGIGG